MLVEDRPLHQVNNDEDFQCWNQFQQLPLIQLMDKRRGKFTYIRTS